LGIKCNDLPCSVTAHPIDNENLHSAPIVVRVEYRVETTLYVSLFVESGDNDRNKARLFLSMH
jgi:hypothetical protein